MIDAVHAADRSGGSTTDRVGNVGLPGDTLTRASTTTTPVHRDERGG
jgi:hypothetical protein